MAPFYSQPMLDIADFLANPSEVTRSISESVAIMQNGQVLFYAISPKAYMMNSPANAPHHALSPVLQQAPALTEASNDHTLPFSQYVDHYLVLEALRVERNELTEKSYKIIYYRLHKYILPTFGKVNIGDIQYVHLEKFVQTLSEQKIGGVAISQYLAIIRKILKSALLRQALTSLPEFPKVIGKRQSRGGFNIQEYLTLQQVSWRMRGTQFSYQNQVHLNATGLDQRYMEMSLELHYLIGFMANSFVRPSDIKMMKHKHIELIENEHRYLRMTLPETKKHGKPIVTLRRAVTIYKKLAELGKAAGYGRPDDYVFLPEVTSRTYALRILGFLFNWLLYETNLKQGPHGIPRTLYSLRHTSITFRLLYGQGIDMLTLARNARTSVKMIENHYASTLSGEMNIGLLQSKRSVRAVYK